MIDMFHIFSEVSCLNIAYFVCVHGCAHVLVCGLLIGFIARVIWKHCCEIGEKYENASFMVMII